MWVDQRAHPSWEWSHDMKLSRGRYSFIGHRQFLVLGEGFPLECKPPFVYSRFSSYTNCSILVWSDFLGADFRTLIFTCTFHIIYTPLLHTLHTPWSTSKPYPLRFNASRPVTPPFVFLAYTVEGATTAQMRINTKRSTHPIRQVYTPSRWQ